VEGVEAAEEVLVAGDGVAPAHACVAAARMRWSDEPRPRKTRQLVGEVVNGGCCRHGGQRPPPLFTRLGLLATCALSHYAERERNNSFAVLI
jgi:hypothetical protein